MPSGALSEEGRLYVLAGLGGPIPLRHEKADRPALD
jgi:hypothetical protein